MKIDITISLAIFLRGVRKSSINSYKKRNLRFEHEMKINFQLKFNELDR